MKLVRVLAVLAPIVVALSSRSSLGSTGSGGAGGAGGMAPIPGLSCNMGGSGGNLDVAVVQSSTARMSTQDPRVISYADCTTGVTLEFDFDATGLEHDTVQVLALSPTHTVDDCISSMNRGVPMGGCTSLGFFPSGPGQLFVSAKKIANVLTNGNGCTDIGGDAGPDTVQLYLIGDPSDTTSTTAYCTYAASVDLIGPAPPVGLSAGVEDQALDITFNSADPSAQTFSIYCDAGGTPEEQGGAGSTSTASSSASSASSTAMSGAGGAAGAGGAGGAGGAMGSGGKGGGSNLLPGCAKSHVLVPGTTPDPTYFFANFSGSEVLVDRVLHQPMKDGTEYACAVAALDEVGNMGVLSDVVCGVPQTTDDFFGQYRGDSGQAGGGFCAIGRGSSAFAATSAVIGLSLLAFAGRRRRRNAKRR